VKPPCPEQVEQNIRPVAAEAINAQGEHALHLFAGVRVPAADLQAGGVGRFDPFPRRLQFFIDGASDIQYSVSITCMARLPAAGAPDIGRRGEPWPAYAARQGAREMVQEKLLHRITLDPGVLVGKPTVRGLRISVQQILNALASGVSIEDLLQDYPELEPEDIQACIAYAAALVAEERVYPVAAP
jgi:uncharacterized protein (DUF433 family)